MSKRGYKKRTKSKKRGNIFLRLAVALLLLLAYTIYDNYLYSPIEERDTTSNTKREVVGSGSKNGNSAGEKKSTQKGLELPFISKSEIIVKYGGYTVSYNVAAKLPHWVAYELTKNETSGEHSREGMRFRCDEAFLYPQAEDSDYRNSGWARGHMAPAADFKWSSKAMEETFYFTNCCPQNQQLNGGMWSTLEKKVRDYAVKYGKVWVVTGPLIGKNINGTIGKNKVTVPDSFFKALLIKSGGKFHSIAFIMENRRPSANMQSSAVTINRLEEIAGIDLFAGLDTSIEEEVENNYTLSLWNL